MANDVENKRQAITKAYSTESWKDKVRNMSDSQVIAVYFRFKREGKI